MAAKGCTLGFLQGCYLWKFTDAPRDDHTFTHMQAALNENIGSEKKEGKQQQQLKVVIEKSWGLENRLGNGLWQNILYTCINFPQIQQNLLMFYVRKKIPHPHLLTRTVLFCYTLFSFTNTLFLLLI